MFHHLALLMKKGLYIARERMSSDALKSIFVVDMIGVQCLIQCLIKAFIFYRVLMYLSSHGCLS